MIKSVFYHIFFDMIKNEKYYQKPFVGPTKPSWAPFQIKKKSSIILKIIKHIVRKKQDLKKNSKEAFSYFDVIKEILYLPTYSAAFTQIFITFANARG